MKVYLKNGTIIECDVEEFEALYTRGVFGENGMQKALDDFIKEKPLLPDTPTVRPVKFPKNTETMIYGCGMPQTFTCRAPSSESVEQDNTDYKVDSVDHQQEVDNRGGLWVPKEKPKHFDEDEDYEKPIKPKSKPPKQADEDDDDDEDPENDD